MALLRSIFWGVAISLVVGLGLIVMSFGDSAAFQTHERLEAWAGALVFFVFVTPLLYVGARRQKNYLICMNCSKAFYKRQSECDSCQGPTISISKFYKTKNRSFRKSAFSR